MDVEPRVTVIVPTMGRFEKLLDLLSTLHLQTVPLRDIELIVVIDELSDEPHPVCSAEIKCPVLVLQQQNQGPAAARNRAIEHARGPILLILNDDALLAPDVVERHLARQTEAEGLEAILGRFDFTPEALRSPLCRMFTIRDTFLFPYSTLSPGGLHSGTSFWTCNLSVPTAAVRSVGGFDERFRHAIAEDTELGVRLDAKLGLKVRYCPDICAWHNHVQDIRSYRRRQMLSGYYAGWIMESFGDPEKTRLAREKAGLDRSASDLRSEADRRRAACQAAITLWDLVTSRTPPGCDPPIGWNELDRATVAVASQPLAVGSALWAAQWPVSKLFDAETRGDAPFVVRSGPVTVPTTFLQLLRARADRIVAWVAPGTLFPQHELATLHRHLSWWPDVVAVGPSWLESGDAPPDPRRRLQLVAERSVAAQRDAESPAEWPDAIDPRLIVVDRTTLLELLAGRNPTTWPELWGIVGDSGYRLRRSLDVWAVGP